MRPGEEYPAPGRRVASPSSGHGAACGCKDCQIRQILAVLREPVGLPGASLPPYGTIGPDCCQGCLLGPVYQDGRCVYCHELTAVILAGLDERKRQERIRDAETEGRRIQHQVYRRRTVNALLWLIAAGIVVLTVAYVVGGSS